MDEENENDKENHKENHKENDKKTNKRNIIIAVVASLMVGGFVVYFIMDNIYMNHRRYTNMATSFAVTLDQATSMALEMTGGGVVREIDTDIRYNGVPVYEIEIINDNVIYEIYINANTAEVLKFESRRNLLNPLNSDANSTSNQEVASEITAERAKEIALAQTSGGNVRKAERYIRENGMVVYEIEIRNNDIIYEIYIDAATEAILKFELIEETVAPPSAAAPTVTAPPTNNNVSSQSGTGEITAERARQIALSQTNGGTVRSVERYVRPSGQVVYEVEVRDGALIHEVYIDARTETILKFETEPFS